MRHHRPAPRARGKVDPRRTPVATLVAALRELRLLHALAPHENVVMPRRSFFVGAASPPQRSGGDGGDGAAAADEDNDGGGAGVLYAVSDAQAADLVRVMGGRRLLSDPQIRLLAYQVRSRALQLDRKRVQTARLA